MNPYPRAKDAVAQHCKKTLVPASPQQIKELRRDVHAGGIRETAPLGETGPLRVETPRFRFPYSVSLPLRVAPDDEDCSRITSIARSACL